MAVSSSTGARGGLATGVVAAIVVVYPFRLVLQHLTGVDHHLGLVSIAALALVVVATVRSRPVAFPTLLDGAVLAYLVLAIVHLLAVSGAGAMAIKAMQIDARFVLFYGAARLLDLRLGFGRWILGVTVAVAGAAAILGALEYHLAWGALLRSGIFEATPSFWKRGLPRLYSFPMNVTATAYLLVLGLAASLAFVATDRARIAVRVVVVAIGHALPLTLARAPFTLAVAIVVTFLGLDRRRGRALAGWSVASLGVSLGIFWLRGWLPRLLGYAAVGGSLADGSARVHLNVFVEGARLLVERPLGWGFGEAGFVAMFAGGALERAETHYVTLAVQLGVPGLVAFAAVLVAAGLVWLALVRAEDVERRAFGIAGAATFAVLLLGGVFVGTWTMMVPQLYVWLLTAIAVNVLAAPSRFDGASA